MLSIENFNAAVSAYYRRLNAVIVATLFTAILCVAVYYPFKDSIDRFYTRQFGEAAAQVFMGMTMFPALVVMFFGFWMNELRTRRDARLACPHCRKWLVTQRHLVVATRNCGHCGRKVLAEPLPPT